MENPVNENHLLLVSKNCIYYNAERSVLFRIEIHRDLLDRKLRVCPDFSLTVVVVFYHMGLKAELQQVQNIFHVPAIRIGQSAEIEKGKKKPKERPKKESTPEYRDRPEDLPHLDDQGIRDNEGERKDEERDTAKKETLT